MISNIEEIIKSLLEKELIVSSFSAPKFVKVRDSFDLIKFLQRVLLKNKENKYNLINLFGSEEVAIFNKYFDTNSLKNIHLKDIAPKSTKSLHTENTNSLTQSNNIKDFFVVNKEPKIITVLEKDISHSKNNFNKNNQVFYSYLEKLKKITNDIKHLNQTKLFKASINNSNYHKKGNDEVDAFRKNNHIKLNTQSTPNINYNNSISNYTNSVNEKNVSLSSNSKITINDNKVAHSNIQNNIDTKANNFSQSYINSKDNPNNVYNEFISGLNNKIDNLVKILTPYFEEIIAKLGKLGGKDEATEESLNNGFKELKNNISDIKSLCDLNGLDIDNLSDLLNKIDFKELIKLLKDINVNIHKLINKQEKLNQDEIEVSNELKSLEGYLKTYNKEQLEAFTKQISFLDKKQSEYSLTQVENRDIIVNEIKNILNVLKSTSNPVYELQERLNNILKKQESLFQEAINIKNYIVNNKKDSIVEENNSEKGLHVLIEEIKSNNNVVKEQNVFNEKIYKDMEIIKKSIIKLIDEQAKENNKALNANKPLKEDLPNHDNKFLLNKHNSLKNEVINSESEYNIKKTPQDINTNKIINNKDSHKSAQVKMAIGKLKEALDLDSIHTIKELHTEYIDEIIEEKISNNPEKISNNSNNTHNKVNNSELNAKMQKSNKNNQSTFVLDNSKFFK